MNVLIVEDEPLYANHLEIIVDSLGYNCLGIVNNANDALGLAEAQPPDLVLMDIGITGAYDGIETAERLRAKHNCAIIFITAFHDDQTFARAQRVGAANFLLKPFNEVQVRRAIQMVTTAIAPPEKPEVKANEQDVLYVKVGDKLRKIPLGAILSVTADGRYCNIHTERQHHPVRISFKELQERLPSGVFVQVHRSHLVNENYVDQVDLRSSEVILKDGRRVPLAKREREAFLRRVDRL